MPKKIFLSPSNQTDNTYAYGSTTEAVQCGRIADACKTALERCGFAVKISHLDSMAEKVRQSNAWPADLHIPIHTNAFNGKTSGTRMFYYAEGTSSYQACQAIFDALAPITPGASENMKAYPSLYEMRNTDATSVYVEVDFHDVPSVAKWIIAHPAEIGEAICQGVCNYYGVAYQGPGGSSSGESGGYTVGWNQNSKGWWYADSPNSCYKSRWAQISGKWYYFDEEGYMAANQWIMGEQTSYYVGADGAMVTGKTLKVDAAGRLVPAGEYYNTLADVPEVYRETVEKLIAGGVLKGRGGEGAELVLDMSEDAVRLLVVLDRSGVFA